MKKFFCVDLKNHFNHKFIAEENCIDKTISRWNGSGIIDDGFEDGVFYSSNSLPDSLEYIELNNVLFVFPDKSIDELDNITCEGEVIDIPDLSCTALCFLGLSDRANIRDKVKLAFIDGSFEEVDIFFYKWNKGNKLYITDTIDEECEIALKSIRDKASNGYIYSYKSKVKACEKKLSSIELPFNPCLHILSITMECV